MTDISIEPVFDRWVALSTAQGDFEEFEMLEHQILAHTPANTFEAATILVVLAHSLEGDVRSDGADVAALRRIATCLRSPIFPTAAAA